MGSNGTVTELQRNSTNWTVVVDEIVKMEKQIFPKHESLARSFDEELKKKNSGLLYIQIHGQVVGYVMYAWARGLLPCLLLSRSLQENYRGQGHGEALLEAAIKKCRTRTVPRITLHVDPLRTPAVNLYKQFGFQVDTLIQGYYSADRPAYRMYKDFDSK
ncbi:hypothetical protein WN944_015856 [Citrus x changshan-huyou]|uniref:N-acetyltransferase domain-containing protein n=1 Tax=Citrus x changshan-huyou TaxID=2935761 RepID=A0AAP0QJW7_9ROSI